MTKQQELAVLDGAIEKLGADSYLGPWLSQIRAEVESNIRSDFFPQITLKDSVDEGNRLIARAKSDAADIVAKAEAQSAQSLKDSQRVRDSLMSAIHAANRELQKW